MIYSLNKTFDRELVRESVVPREIVSAWRTNKDLCDYYYYYEGSEFWTIGFMKVDNCYCAIDFRSSLKNGITSLRLLSTVLSFYKNIYAVPNASGRTIWSSINFIPEPLFINIRFRPKIFKFCYNSRRYFYLNLFIGPDTNGFVKLNRTLFFKGEKPKIIYLDTF